MEAAPAPEQVRGLACAVCGAGMRADAPWCTLCLTPVETAPVAAATPVETTPVPAATPVPATPVPAARPPVELDPLTAPLHVLLGEPAPAPARSIPAWPCGTCGRANDLEAAVCAGCGDGFLSVVAAAEAASMRVPVVGDLRALTPGQRRMLNVAVILLLIVLLLVLAVLGAAFG